MDFIQHSDNKKKLVKKNIKQVILDIN